LETQLQNKIKKRKNSSTDLLRAARCGLVAVLEGALLEAPPKELEHVVLPDAVVSLAVVVEPRLPCLEDTSRFRAPCDLPPANCRPVRRGVATPAAAVAVAAAAAAAAIAFLAGALEGRISAPEAPLPLVCAARISGAIRAISGNEFGAETIAARRLAAGSLPPTLARWAPSGNRR